MSVEISEWAQEVLRRADEAARRFNSAARVRLSASGSALSADLTDEPAPDDEVWRSDALEIYVARDVEGLVDVEPPHDRLVLRAPGTPPRARDE